MTDAQFRVLREGEGRAFDVLGSRMSYKATAADTGGSFSLAVETTPPRGGLPLHVHRREDEAMYILEGEYEVQCGERIVRAEAGTFVMLPRNVPNRCQNLGDKPGRFLYITSPGGFERLVEQTSARTRHGPPDM